jgi:hydroxyacylglutathione hydrolase|tara:strand:+ start:166 stop:1536 length:1371 start_codon:yes stop_codon:yes gene_type:complete
MIFRQHYLECLSQASYLIGDETTGRAVVVDPVRDVEMYLIDARTEGLEIEMVIETHIHADFVSGHPELAATGVEVAFGSAATTDYPIRKLEHGEVVDLGGVRLEILHTPGHTPESISILVFEHGDDVSPWAVLTGDTLFNGDVGRPDLLVSVDLGRDQMASILFDSIHGQLMTLPDPTRMYPGHGAGSACGKNLSSVVWSTIGEQRSSNYAVRLPDRDSFVAAICEGQPTQPGYFPHAVAQNTGQRSLLVVDPPDPLRLSDVVAAQAAGAVVIDTRDHQAFARGHLIGSINVGLEGRFAEFVGCIVRPSDEVVFVCEEGTEAEARIRLSRIGYDNVVGHLPSIGMILADHPEVSRIASRLTAAQLSERLDTVPVLQILDVRNAPECEAGSLPGAVHIPLAQLADRHAEMDPILATVVFCAGGYRSSVAASLLRSRGFPDVSDLLGGYGACSIDLNP